jgi:membrane-bound inhibitor of C-type lysozyme
MALAIAAAPSMVIAAGNPPAVAGPVVATPEPDATPTAASALTITLGTTGDFERKTIKYGCQGDQDSLSVDYLNVAPNYLALIPIDGTTLLFNTVLSASGARYAAGKYIWLTKGADGSLYDLTEGANAKPILTCSEVNETP